MTIVQTAPCTCRRCRPPDSGTSPLPSLESIDSPAPVRRKARPLSLDHRSRESPSTSTVMVASDEPAYSRTVPSSVENEDCDIDPPPLWVELFDWFVDDD